MDAAGWDTFREHLSGTWVLDHKRIEQWVTDREAYLEDLLELAKAAYEDGYDDARDDLQHFIEHMDEPVKD